MVERQWMPLPIPNHYRIEGEVAYLTITRKNGESFEFKFDAPDLEDVQRHHWHVMPACESKKGTRYFYATTNVPDGTNKQAKLRLAELILDPRPDQVVSYHNDRQDCRRANITVESRKTVCLTAIRDLPPSGYRNIEKRAEDRWIVWRSRKHEGMLPNQYIKTFKTLPEALAARDVIYKLQSITKP